MFGKSAEVGMVFVFVVVDGVRREGGEFVLYAGEVRSWLGVGTDLSWSVGVVRK